jgi:septum formation protein
MDITSSIILASASPRRKQLLEQAEITFKIVTQDTKEDYPLDLPIDEVPTYIAYKKAMAVAPLVPDTCTIIAADTIVVLNNEVIGKPMDHADAVAILKKLSGQVHQVITGVVIIKNKSIIKFNELTTVHFNDLSNAQIEHYITRYKPFDKAGAYAIQEWIGVIGIKKIEGCFYNVMGLPVSKVLAHL